MVGAPFMERNRTICIEYWIESNEPLLSWIENDKPFKYTNNNGLSDIVLYTWAPLAPYTAQRYALRLWCNSVGTIMHSASCIECVCVRVYQLCGMLVTHFDTPSNQNSIYQRVKYVLKSKLQSSVRPFTPTHYPHTSSPHPPSHNVEFISTVMCTGCVAVAVEMGWDMLKVFTHLQLC